MPSVADLLEPVTMQRLAQPSDLEAGQALADQARVTLVRFGPLDVHATVAHGVVWSCDCPEGRQGAFCRHCVAAARMTWEKAPPKRTRSM